MLMDRLQDHRTSILVVGRAGGGAHTGVGKPASCRRDFANSLSLLNHRASAGAAGIGQSQGLQ